MIFQNISLLLCVASSTILFGVAERLNSKRKLGGQAWTCGPELVYEDKISAPITVTSSIDHCLDASLTQNLDFWELDVVEGVPYSIDFQKLNCNMLPEIELYKVNKISDVQCVLDPNTNRYELEGVDYVTMGVDDATFPVKCTGVKGKHISFTPDSTGTYALTVRNVRNFDNTTCTQSYDYEFSFDITPKCVSVNGIITEQHGNQTYVTCSSWDASGNDGCSNVAIAEGKFATAIAGTKPNDKCLSVKATGNYAYASASGNYQVASAEGSMTKAIIRDGSQNTAVARGPFGLARCTYPCFGLNALPYASVDVNGTLNNVLAVEAVAKVEGTANSLTASEGNKGVINGDYNVGDGKGRYVTYCGKFGCSYRGSISITGNSNNVNARNGVVEVTGDSNYGTSKGGAVYIDGEYNTGNCELSFPSSLVILGTRNNVNVTGTGYGSASAKGNENTVTCLGTYGTRAEVTGDRNYVSARNRNAAAKVIGGNGNIVEAEWWDSKSIVENGDGNYVFAGATRAKATVVNGSGNTAGAEAEDAKVSIEDGNNNSVTHNVTNCIKSIAGVSGQIITTCP